MTNQNPLISICIPAYNAEPFITETINCWTQQTYTNLEIIIQDDCSTDDTYDLALSISKTDPRIKVYKNTRNLGIGGNWNEAYENASGEYVVIFNADDTIKSNFLEKSLKIFNQDSTLDLVLFNYKRSFEVNESNNFKNFEGFTYDVINVDKKHPKRIHWNFTLAKKTSLDRLKNNNRLFHQTQVCDAMLWCEAFKQKLKAYYCADVCGVYRDHPTNNSKIKFGEFESTFLWMVPLYPEIFNMIHPKDSLKSLKLLFSYIYHSLINFRLPNFTAIKNIISYRI